MLAQTNIQYDFTTLDRRCQDSILQNYTFLWMFLLCKGFKKMTKTTHVGA